MVLVPYNTSGNFDLKGNYILNTIGKYGCLFVCAVNIGNSYNKFSNSQNYVEKSVASLASNDLYFSFWVECNWISDFVGVNFESGPKELSKLLFDMTGVNFCVDRYDKSALESIGYLIRTFKKGAYLIGKVGEHFINITNIDEKNEMTYFDPYIRNSSKFYEFNDVEAFYIITTMEEDYELN